MEADDQKLVRVALEGHGVVRLSPRVEHERRVAIHDLIESNRFSPVGGLAGPFVLQLGVSDNRLEFDVRDTHDRPLVRFGLGLAAFRSIVRDYFMVCDSYYKAIGDASPARIEAIDMGRRGLHDEGARLLQNRLAAKVDIDIDTARRLFTLVCVLHIRS